MSDIRTNVFANFIATKAYKFGDIATKIKKLSPAEISNIRELNKELESAPETSDTMKLVYVTCRMGCPDMTELDDDFLSTLPMDELRRMSDEIIVYSGLVQKEDPAKKG